jgi:hypothetical protein
MTQIGMNVKSFHSSVKFRLRVSFMDKRRGGMLAPVSNRLESSIPESSVLSPVGSKEFFLLKKLDCDRIADIELVVIS